jgi:hypothetical protein
VAGFDSVRFHHKQISRQAIELMGAPFWVDMIEKQVDVILDASKD